MSAQRQQKEKLLICILFTLVCFLNTQGRHEESDGRRKNKEPNDGSFFVGNAATESTDVLLVRHLLLKQGGLYNTIVLTGFNERRLRTF